MISAGFLSSYQQPFKSFVFPGLPAMVSRVEDEEEEQRKRSMSKRRVELVFVPIPFIGHVVSTIELAKQLMARHHRISITILLLKFPLSPDFNLRIKSLDDKIRFVDLPQLELPSPNRYQTPDAMMSVFLEDHKPSIKTTITQLFLTPESSDSRPARLAGLFIDLVCTPMIDVATELGIPSYIYFASTASFLSLLLHLPALDTNINSETELTIPGFNNTIPTRILPWALNQDGYTWAAYHGRRFREAKGIIVNTFAELEPHLVRSLSSDDSIPPVYPVGPLLDPKGLIHSESDQTRFRSVKTWLDGQPSSSVVFLCFGSGGSFSKDQVKEIAIGLDRSGHRFLWSVRQPAQVGDTNLEELLPEGFLDRTASRGLICEWVPQVAVLAHHAIGGFVSHCGWNSILESLWFDVPIAAWPLYAEQHLNAFEMLKELGGLVVELRLDYKGGNDLVKAEEVERAVCCLMDSDCEVRKKVKEMGEKSRRVLMDGGSSFTYMERLIEDLMAET